MNMESILYLIVLLVLAFFSIWALLNMKSFYTDPKRLPRKPPVWWPYTKEGWLRWARAIPTFVSYGIPGTVGAAIAEYGDLSNPVVRGVLLLSGFLVFFGFVLGLVVAFFGHPKWLIPPHLR
jgi:hypothetical protein